jgi:hypothetical protein
MHRRAVYFGGSIVCKVSSMQLVRSYSRIYNGRHVVDKMLPIDVTTLCEVIDYLCGSIILVRANFYLHNMTLPRSWFITLLRRLKNIMKGAKTDFLNLQILIGSIAKLLDRLQAGPGTGEEPYSKLASIGWEDSF